MKDSNWSGNFVIDTITNASGTPTYSSGGAAFDYKFRVVVDVPGSLSFPLKPKPNYYYKTIKDQAIVSSAAVDKSRYNGKAGSPQTSSGPKTHPDWSRIYSLALDDLNEKVRGSLDLSIDTFQAGQTAQLHRYVTRFASETASFLRGIKRSPVKEVSKRYLEYVYGIKPTMQSIYDLYEKYYNDPGLPVRLVSRRSLRSLSTGTRDYRWPTALTSFGYFRYKREVSTRCHLEVRLKLRSPSTMQQLAGYSSLNPISIVWELVPYSFVVDWIYNVGGYVRNFETAMIYGDLFDSGYYTITQLDNTSDIGLVTTHPAILYSNMGSPGCENWSIKERIVLASYPSPRRPVLNLDLSSQRLLNAAALLGNLL